MESWPLSVAFVGLFWIAVGIAITLALESVVGVVVVLVSLSYSICGAISVTDIKGDVKLPKLPKLRKDIKKDENGNERIFFFGMILALLAFAAWLIWLKYLDKWREKK